MARYVFCLKLRKFGFFPCDTYLFSWHAFQKQWWEFKSKHMDKVLFFKVRISSTVFNVGEIMLISVVQVLNAISLLLV